MKVWGNASDFNGCSGFVCRSKPAFCYFEGGTQKGKNLQAALFIFTMTVGYKKDRKNTNKMTYVLYFPL